MINDNERRHQGGTRPRRRSRAGGEHQKPGGPSKSIRQLLRRPSNIDVRPAGRDRTARCSACQLRPAPAPRARRAATAEIDAKGARPPARRPGAWPSLASDHAELIAGCAADAVHHQAVTSDVAIMPQQRRWSFVPACMVVARSRSCLGSPRLAEGAGPRHRVRRASAWANNWTEPISRRYLSLLASAASRSCWRSPRARRAWRQALPTGLHRGAGASASGQGEEAGGEERARNQGSGFWNTGSVAPSTERIRPTARSSRSRRSGRARRRGPGSSLRYVVSSAIRSIGASAS